MNTEHTNQSRQAEPVNQQLLALVKSFGHKTGCAKNAFGELCTCGVDEAIAAAEKAQAELRSVFDQMFDYSVDPTDDVSREWLWRFSKGLVGRLSSKPPAVAGAAPDGSVPVPLGFLQAFHALAHNYSLQAQAPDHYAGTERDAFSDAYARCGSELAKLRAMLAAAPQATAEDSSVVRDAVAVPTIKLGLYGRAFDTPQTCRAYTYQHQPDNLDAYNLGRAAASTSPGGDNIDRGLSLLKELQAHGFGVFELGDQQEGGAA